MNFGIEALDTVKDLSRKLVTILKQIVSRIEALENAPETPTPIDYQPQIDALDTEVTNLTTKQNAEKRISCIATQRTTNASAYAELPPSDETFAMVSTDNRRRLNNFITNDSTYFELVNPNTGTAFVRIKKPGKYVIRFSSVCMRTGVSTYCFIVIYDPTITQGYRFDRPSNAALATGATAVGNTLVAGGSVEHSFTTGTREVYLNHFFGTRTAGFNYGRFGIGQNSYTDTCSIEIELISE